MSISNGKIQSDPLCLVLKSHFLNVGFRNIGRHRNHSYSVCVGGWRDWIFSDKNMVEPRVRKDVKRVVGLKEVGREVGGGKWGIGR